MRTHHGCEVFKISGSRSGEGRHLGWQLSQGAFTIGGRAGYWSMQMHAAPVHLFHKVQNFFERAGGNELPASFAIRLNEFGGTGTLFPYRIRLDKRHMPD